MFQMRKKEELRKLSAKDEGKGLSRFYIGMHYVGGKPKIMLPYGRPCPAERAYGMAYHCAYEMATLRNILQPLYEMYGH